VTLAVAVADPLALYPRFRSAGPAIFLSFFSTLSAFLKACQSDTLIGGFLFGRQRPKAFAIALLTANGRPC
jgi:hypothetical protein